MIVSLRDPLGNTITHVARRLERIVLGWVMAVAAYLLDRRLRRAR